MAPTKTASGSAPQDPEQFGVDTMEEALASARKLLEEAGQSGFQFAAYQAAVGAMTLTLHNAVAEQQHAHILRMAVTTAAANAILEGRKTEAEDLLALTESKLAVPAVTELMAQIRSCIDSLNQGLREAGKNAGPSSTSTEPTASAATAPPPRRAPRKAAKRKAKKS